MQRFSQPAREMPHAADKSQLDNLAARKIFFHFLERHFVVLRRHDGHFIRPANGGLLLIVEQRALLPPIAVEQFDLLHREAQSSTELRIMAVSVVTLRQKRRLDDYQLHVADILRITLEPIDAQLLIQQQEWQVYGFYLMMWATGNMLLRILIIWLEIGQYAQK